MYPDDIDDLNSDHESQNTEAYSPDPPSIRVECLLSSADRDWLASIHIHPYS
jgi:hypothetical protein